MQHAFLYIFCRCFSNAPWTSQFYVIWRTWTQENNFPFFSTKLKHSPSESTPKKFTNIWQIEWNGMRGMKFQTARIPVFKWRFAAVAFVVAKAPFLYWRVNHFISKAEGHTVPFPFLMSFVSEEAKTREENLDTCFSIAGLHVTSRRPCWWSRTKANLSSNMAALSSGCLEPLEIGLDSSHTLARIPFQKLVNSRM